MFKNTSAQLTVIKKPFTLTTSTTTELETLALNRIGTLVAVNILPTSNIGPFADIFMAAELSYRIQKTQLPLIRGYLKTNFSLTWFGRQPTDTETSLILEFLNASGENQIIEVMAVYDNE